MKKTEKLLKDLIKAMGEKKEKIHHRKRRLKKKIQKAKVIIEPRKQNEGNDVTLGKPKDVMEMLREMPD